MKIEKHYYRQIIREMRWRSRQRQQVEMAIRRRAKCNNKQKSKDGALPWNEWCTAKTNGTKPTHGAHHHYNLSI